MCFKFFGFKQKNELLDRHKQEHQSEDHLISLDELYRKLATNINQGLTNVEAKNRLVKYGLNQLTPTEDTPEWIKFCKQLFGGFSILLWVGAALCFIAYQLQGDVDNVSQI